METIREQLQIFTRRFGLLNATCCDECCGVPVSLTQSHILFEVRRLATPSMQQVAEELGIDITTFSRQAKALETRELISRRMSPDDRRVTLLELTTAGREILTKIDTYMAARLENVFSRMSPFERDIVTRSLGLLNSALVQSSRETTPQEGSIACCK